MRQLASTARDGWKIEEFEATDAPQLRERLDVLEGCAARYSLRMLPEERARIIVMWEPGRCS